MRSFGVISVDSLIRSSPLSGNESRHCDQKPTTLLLCTAPRERKRPIYHSDLCIGAGASFRRRFPRSLEVAEPCRLDISFLRCRLRRKHQVTSCRQKRRRDQFATTLSGQLLPRSGDQARVDFWKSQSRVGDGAPADAFNGPGGQRHAYRPAVPVPAPAGVRTLWRIGTSALCRTESPVHRSTGRDPRARCASLTEPSGL